MVKLLPTPYNTSIYQDERNSFVMESLRQAEPMIQNFAIRYRVDFEELYQAAAAEVLAYYEQAMRAGNPRAYLHRIIRNECLSLVNPKYRKKTLDDHYQILSFSVPLSIDSDLTLEHTIAAIDQVSKEYPQEVYAAIEGLPEKYRISLCMHYGLGYPVHSYKAIGRSLGIPWGTARNWVYKAVELLRAKVAEEVLYG